MAEVLHDSDENECDSKEFMPSTRVENHFIRPNYEETYDSETNQTHVINSKTVAWCLIDRYNFHHWLRTNTLLVIGRGECDIQLKSRSVDPQHAMLTYDFDVHHYKIKDLESRNGTFVNELRIPEDTFVLLDNCDSLRFGYDSTVFRIQKFFTNVNSSREPLQLEALPMYRGGSPADDLRRSEWSVRSSAASSLTMVECPMCSGKCESLPKRPLNLCSEHAASVSQQRQRSPRSLGGSQPGTPRTPQPTLESHFPVKSSQKQVQQSVDRSDSLEKVTKSSSVEEKMNLRKKKASELYGQPDWWGDSEENLNVDTPTTSMNLTSVDNDKRRHSPATRDVAEKPMEQSSKFEKPAVVEKRSQSVEDVQSIARQVSKPSEAFTINLDDLEAVDSVGDQLSAELASQDRDSTALARFVPSKIRKSFKEREEVKRKKVEELRERTKKSQDTTVKSTKPTKSSKTQQPSKSSGNPAKSAPRVSSKNSSKNNSPRPGTASSTVAKKTTTKTCPAISKSQPVQKPPTSKVSSNLKQSTSHSRSNNNHEQGSKNILFDKLFSSRSSSRHEHLPEHDLYKESVVNVGDDTERSAIDEEVCSEAGTYVISESDQDDVSEELEDIEFEKMEAFADSLETDALVENPDLRALSKPVPVRKGVIKPQELELKTSGPKWMSDVVNGNNNNNNNNETPTRHQSFAVDSPVSKETNTQQNNHRNNNNQYYFNSMTLPARVSKSSSECSPRRSRKSSGSTATEEGGVPSAPQSPATGFHTHRTTGMISDVMSASLPPPGRRQQDGPASSIDTACLLQDTAAVLHDMEERLARHTSSENIPFADEENCDLSDGESSVPTETTSLHRRSLGHSNSANLYSRGNAQAVRYNQKRSSLPVGDIFSEEEGNTARTDDSETTNGTSGKSTRRSRFSGLRFAQKSSPRSNVSLGTRILQRSRDNLVQRFDYGRHSLKMATSTTHPPGRQTTQQMIPSSSVTRPPPQQSAGSPSRMNNHTVWTPRGTRPISLHEATLRSGSYSSSSTEDLSTGHRHTRLSEFSRDLERLAKREEFGRRSAFSPRNSPTWVESPPGPYRSKSAAHLPTGEEAAAAYETVLAASLLQVASKLRRCSDDLLARLRRSRHLSRTPSPVEDVFVPPPVPDSAGSELQDNMHSCLYNLQAVQYHLQIIERAIFPQAKSGRNSALGSCSEGDYLLERERINNEIRGFTPIEPAFPATDMKFYTDYKM